MSNGDDEVQQVDLRRLRIVRVSQRAMLNIIRGMAIDESLRAIMLNVPADCSVVSVHFNYVCGCFDFVVSHDSFEFIPEGTELPVSPSIELELERVEDE